MKRRAKRMGCWARTLCVATGFATATCAMGQDVAVGKAPGRTVEPAAAQASLSAANNLDPGPLVAEEPEVAAAQVVAQRPDRNDAIYYRNKLEFSFETGYLWFNTPFIFDVFQGGDYKLSRYHYTLNPNFPSIRWHVGKISGPSVLRGNTDISAALSLTTVPRGYESVYGAFDLGFRRNFVQRNWKAVPYFDFRCGAGFINAQQAHGGTYGQGQDYTFTLMTGVGARYNFNPKWSAELGATYMHVSNGYESEPRYEDFGINVVGPYIGFNRRLGRPREPKYQ